MKAKPAKGQHTVSIQNNLPEGWVWKMLGEVCDILSGYGFPKELQGKTTGDLPFYKVGDISQTWHSGNKYLATANNYISLEKAKGIRAKPFLPGTTVMAKIGEAIKLNRRALLSKPSLVDNNVMGIYPRPEYLDQKYNFYFLLTVKLGAYSQATTVPSVRKSDVSEIAFPLAPLDQQKLIVSEIEKQFSRLDEAVAALKRTKANLKRYKSSVLKAAVEGRLTEEWRKQNPDIEPADKLLKRILAERKKKWEEKNPKKKYKEPAPPDTLNLPELPKGWVWTNVGQISESMKNGIYKPLSSYVDNGVACLRMYNIENGKIVWKDIKRMLLSENEIEEYQLLPCDLLVNRVNSRELVGKAAPIPKGLEVCVFESKNIRVRLLFEFAITNFISYVFTLTGQNFFNRNAQQVVGMASISQPQVSGLPIPLPPLYEQNIIVNEVESRLSVIDEVENEVELNLKRSERLRQSILKKAFSGKLVPQDPNEKSTSKLLEKINMERET